jgi:hypothetical protein
LLPRSRRKSLSTRARTVLLLQVQSLGGLDPARCMVRVLVLTVFGHITAQDEKCKYKDVCGKPNEIP